MSSEVREEALKLMERKDKIEREIQELMSVLQKHGIGMTEPLVDSNDFPLQNIDVSQVRKVRHQIICLQNDHKAIMKQIEAALENYYNSGPSSQTNTDVEMRDQTPEIVRHTVPFAKVTVVTAGSPADYAGIKADDLVVEFGSVNKSNFRDIMDIAGIVQHSEGQQLNVKVQRDGGRFVHVRLVPKKWPGKGLLGCNIVCL